jgi:hypothetical protein
MTPIPTHPARCLALPLLTALALLSCAVDTPTSAGGSTETINGHTVAMLYNPDGTPAAGATVRFVPEDLENGPAPVRARTGAVCSTTTDAHGHFRFDSVPGDVYNIFGELDGNVSFQASVPVAAGHAEAEPDTLRAPGTLRGYIELSHGLDYKTVYALVPGSFTYSDVDSSGAFALSGLAEGDYRMRFYTTMDDWEPVDTVLPVFAGVDSLWPDTIRMKYSGIPVPTGLRLEYDSMMLVVTVRWNRCDPALVSGYHVSRRHEDSSYVQVNAAPLTDTVFHDSGASLNQTYEYTVAALDVNANQGAHAERVRTTIVPAYKMVDTLSCREFGVVDYLWLAVALDDWVGLATDTGVALFDSDLELRSSFSVPSLDPRDCNAEFDVDGRLWVGGRDESLIRIYSRDGEIAAEVRDSVNLRQPRWIARHPNGDMYIVSKAGRTPEDTAYHIAVYDQAGSFSTLYPAMSNPLIIDNSAQVAVAPDGRVVVYVDHTNDMIIHSPAGQEIARNPDVQRPYPVPYSNGQWICTPRCKFIAILDSSFTMVARMGEERLCGWPGVDSAGRILALNPLFGRLEVYSHHR